MLGLSRWQIFKTSAAAVLAVGTISLLLIYFIPAPPSTVTMGTAYKGTTFEYFGQRYRDIFARSHVELKLRETDGAVDNIELLKNPNSGVQIALDFGGISDGEPAPGVLSLRNAYTNPFWIFYSSDEPLDRLSQLKGKRIAVGPVGSGTHVSAERLLGRSGVDSTTATLLPFGGAAAAAALNESKADVVWTAGPPDAPTISSLLRNPKVRLMSFPMADAFTRVFPYRVRLVLPQGVIDLDSIIPPNDVVLIGTTTKVLVRNDLHPQIVQLLLQTMVEAHGGANIFQRVGEFPNAADPEYPVAIAASDFYKSGPSLTQRYLPLWLSVHAQRAIAVLVAGLAIGLPTFRFLPVFYQWVMRRRLIYWYAKLKALEASFDANANAISLPETKIEVERIEDAVSHIQFPLTFTDQLYNLRSHIDIVRRKIASRREYARVNGGAE
ncbi:MAG: TAXI family TRAP transporter solute-binding subunit [Xanthobacteraceae bacterium]